MPDRSLKHVAVSGVLTLLGAYPAAAQPVSPVFEQGYQIYRDAAIRTWHQRLLPEFRRVADARTRSVLGEVQFEVGRFGDFNAWALYQSKRIVVPVGLLMVIDGIADAEVLANAAPHCRPVLERYIRRLGDAYMAAYRTQWWPGVDFPSMCGMSPAEIQVIRNDSQSYALKTTLIVDSLAVVVGHELGHLVLHSGLERPESASESRARETAADQFGLHLATKAGFFPLFVVTTVYPIFATLEDEGTAAGEGDHPPVSCRVLAALDVVESDPSFADDRSVAARALHARIDDARSQLQRECGNESRH